MQFKTSSADLTLERQLVDQVPITGRNPYNLADARPDDHVSPATNENRPYHHAYANDYDAGGGTRRANDVLLDGVALGASFKTAYTPAVDAVEEITVSKNSVDAENGHSLGGIISLNMKSGTNQPRGSGYYYGRDPEPERHQPIRRFARTPGQDTRRCAAPSCRCTAARSAVPIKREQDLQLHVVRAVGRQAAATRSSARCRPSSSARGDFSQSVAERARADHLQPVRVDARSPRAASCATRLRATSSRRDVSIRSR